MTPYQRLQPFFDAYNSKITDARSEHHMSLNDLSEAAGVSYSAIATQSAGTACNPKLFEQAAIADLFGLSLDELCGLREPQDVSELTERIHQLELENVRQAGDIRRLEELDAEKDKRFSSYRPMVYALVAVCVLLVCALIAYMIFDASVKDAGLFQSTGTSVFVVALAPLILATLVVVGIAVRSDVAMWQERK